MLISAACRYSFVKPVFGSRVEVFQQFQNILYDHNLLASGQKNQEHGGLSYGERVVPHQAGKMCFAVLELTLNNSQIQQ